MKTLRSNYIIVLIVFLVALLGVSTILAWNYARNSVRYNAQVKFDEETHLIEQLILQRFEVYVNALYGARGLFAASEDVTRAEWMRYVAALDIQKNYPGVQGVGFALVVPSDSKTRHIQNVRAEGFPSYTITPEGVRDIYTSIIYLEPFEGRNLRAFGYDMFSEPVRREAMIRARDSGEAALSGKVTLVQENGQDVQAGFLLYVPVYYPILKPETVEERRDYLLGYAYSPFRANDFMHGILGSRTFDIDFEIIDSGSPDSDKELYDNDSGEFSKNPNYLPMFSTHRTLTVAGHTWTIRYVSLPNFMSDAIEQHIPSFVLGGGLLITILVFITLFSLVTSERRALEIAASKTEMQRKNEIKLASVNSKLTTLINSLPLGVLAEDDQRRVAQTNTVFCTLFHIPVPPEKLIGYDCALAAEESKEMFVNPEAFIDRIRQIITDRKPVMGEQLQLRNGKVYERDYLPIFTDKSFVGNLWVYSDITERKDAEERLQARTQQLERINSVMVDREIKMVELKKEIEKLKNT